MAFVHKENSGSLFKNDKKNGNQPDYKGTINVNGAVLEIAGWIKSSADGKSFMSLKVSEPRQRDGL